MKKYILTLIAALSILIMPTVSAKVDLPEKTDHEKVKVYLFYSSTCGNCHNLLKYFSSKYLDYTDYFEFVTYQVDNNQNNSKLSAAVAEKTGEEQGYVPLVIIGNTYHNLGFGGDAGEEITKAALDAYQDDNYTDIVAEIKKDKKIDAKETTFVDACDVSGIKCKTADSKSGISDGAVIGIIFGVIVLGFGGLVVLSRKK